MRGFLVNVDRCNGCYNCQIACKDEYCDQPWLPYSEAQPQVGQFWMRLNEVERGQTPLVCVSSWPVFCQHCQDAPCESAAPEGLFERREDGLLVLKPIQLELEQAEKIAAACPIGAIYVDRERGLAQKCAGCAHLLDDTWKTPRCVDACPTEALRFGEIEDFEEEFERGQVICECLSGAKPLVRYLNMPKRFAGGTIITSEDNEVVIGATVDLTLDGEVVASMETDDFGDWLFEQIEPAHYLVKVHCAGKPEAVIEVDTTERDVYAGVCDLSKDPSERG